MFYQNGTWAWTDLQKNGMKAESIGMLPIYTGVKGEENQGLATGSENYWCINSKASDADKQATKDFLKWVVTSKTGIESLSSAMGFTTPFKSFSDVKSDNPLVQAAVEDQNSDKTAVSWNFTMMPSEEWKNQLGSALLSTRRAPATGMPSRPHSWTVGRPNTTRLTDRLEKPIVIAHDESVRASRSADRWKYRRRVIDRITA